MSTNSRPTTCHEMWLADPELGAKGCKRLPRHGGDHRAALTAAAARRAEARKAAKAVAKPKASKKAAKRTLNDLVRDIRAQVGQPRGRLNAAKRRQAIGLILANVEAGVISAGDGLGLTARFA